MGFIIGSCDGSLYFHFYRGFGGFFTFLLEGLLCWLIVGVSTSLSSPGVLFLWIFEFISCDAIFISMGFSGFYFVVRGFIMLVNSWDFNLYVGCD